MTHQTKGGENAAETAGSAFAQEARPSAATPTGSYLSKEAEDYVLSKDNDPNQQITAKKLSKAAEHRAAPPPPAPFSGMTNIIGESETRRQVGAAIQKISDTVACTMGPYGSTTIVQDRQMQHYVTKDGYTVLKNIAMVEDVQRTVLDMVKRISRNLVSTVGDGSTSAVVVASHLYRSLSGIAGKSGAAHPGAVVSCLKALGEIIAKEITSKALPAGDKELSCVARVSTNNDLEAAGVIMQAYEAAGKGGSVVVKEGLSPYDDIEVSSGMELHRGYISQLFANDEAGLKCEMENVFVFMCDDALTESDMPYLMKMIEQTAGAKQCLVFVCKRYDQFMRQFFQVNMTNHKGIGLCAVDIPVETRTASNRFDDLACYLGATPYSKVGGEILKEPFGLERLGQCRSFTCTSAGSKFIGGHGDADSIMSRAVDIKAGIEAKKAINDHLDRDADIAEELKRITALTASTSTLWVGGGMDTERTARKFLMEDAAFAVASAAEHGVVPGGCLFVPMLLRADRMHFVRTLAAQITGQGMLPMLNAEETMGFAARLIDCVDDAYVSSFEKVLSNAGMDEGKANDIATRCAQNGEVYDVVSGSWGDRFSGVVLMSAQTEVEIIKAAFGMIGLLLTSNQFLTVNPR
jgi:chaperonin GroEL